MRDEKNPGLICPRCGCSHLPAAYTRHYRNATRRARKCRHCGLVMETEEKIRLIKRDES